MDAFADDLIAARKALKIEKWLLCGASTGGMVALLTALKDPAAVSGLILIGTAGSHRFMRGSMYDASGPKAAEIGQQMRSLVAQGDRKEYSKAIFRLSVADPEATPVPSEFGVREDGFSMPRMMAFGQNVATYDVEDRLAEIQCPTLVLVGRQDPQCPLPNSERLAAGIPNAELHVFENCGHFPQWEKSVEFRETIDNWIKG
jgi:proline iminopeptidase